MKAWINWLILGCCGLVLVIAVFLVDAFLVPWAIRYQVGNTMALKKGSDAWKRWTDTPVPIYLKIYMFNVENPEEAARGAKPRVREVGPYVYREYRRKDPIQINTKTDTIDYNQTLTFVFNQEKSGNLSEDDVITVINPGIVVVMQIIEGMPLVENLQAVLDFGLPEVLGESRYQPFVNLTVRELLWDGMVLMCNQSRPSASTRLLCSSFRRLMPMQMLFPTDGGNFKIAVVKYKNGTADGPYQVGSGVKDPEDLGRIKRWHDSETSQAWSGEPCNKIEGSDSALLPLFLEKDSKLSIFSSDICSSVAMKYKSGTEYAGISGYRFTPRESFLGSVEDHKENYCYCPGSIKGTIVRPGGCLKKGLLDVSSCLQAPGLVSFPHLMGASEDYTQSIEGLSPNISEHSTFIDVEPTTGVPLRGYQRVQINLLVKPVLAVRPLQKMSVSILPLFWMEEGFELPEEEQQMLRDQLLKVLKIVLIIKWVLVACGIVMAILGFGMAYYKRRSSCFNVAANNHETNSEQEPSTSNQNDETGKTTTL